MRTIYGYNNRLWLEDVKLIHTGQPQSVTLSAGEHLIICNGAKGGNSQLSEGCHGGTSYGILSLSESQNVYAYVGGNGDNENNDSIADGGFNGGGHGGDRYSSSYLYAAGGGGATDLRLLRPEDVPIVGPYYPTIPSGYTQVEYIESTCTQAIITQQPLNVDVTVNMEYAFMNNVIGGNAGLFGAEAGFATWTIQSVNDQIAFRQFYGNENYGNVPTLYPDVQPGQKVPVEIHGGMISVNDVVLKDTSPGGNGPANPFGMFCVNFGTPDSRLSYGRLYWLRFFVNQTGTQIFYHDDQARCELSGRRYVRSNNDPAWCFIAVISVWGTPYSGPMSISFTKAGAEWDGGSWSTGAATPFTYNGVTLYHSETGNWMSGSISDALGNLTTVNGVTYPLTDQWFCDFLQSIIGPDPYNPEYIQPGVSMSHEYVPVIRDSDNFAGLWDTVTETFITDYWGNGTSFITGQAGRYELPDASGETPEEKQYKGSMNSRFIVAGGGAGAPSTQTSSHNVSIAGFGGGTVGGITTDGHFAAQDSGYSFGDGQDADAQTSDTHSLPGAGGGWFGGYATSVNASGGSGYVLTSTSYKPTDYSVPSQFEMTGTYTTSMSSTAGSISICSEITYDQLEAGDTIIFNPVGKGCKITLPNGSYIAKCWGGDGGVPSNMSLRAKGGYAEGRFINSANTMNIVAYVGGTGLCPQTTANKTYIDTARSDIAFNGGGYPTTYGSNTNNIGCYGGGSSDIRLKAPSEFVGADADNQSLLTRFIVAGGAGGSSAYAGGDGGGTVGETPDPVVQSVDAGGGTQNSSGVNPDYPIINGSFGYGGGSYGNMDSYSGGAGGGGWFGGSGTAVNGVYPPNGGCGGSGYVYTDNSFEPTGYDVPESLKMTDTALTQGGNNLPYGQTKIEIDVVSRSTFKLLCKDASGLKTFDDNSSRWVIINEDVTPETFNEYGVSSIPNDDGLLDEYQILLYDPDDNYAGADIDVVAAPQEIVCDVTTNTAVDSIFCDYDINPTYYDIDIKMERYTFGITKKIRVTATITKKGITDQIAKLYLVGAVSQ